MRRQRLYREHTPTGRRIAAHHVHKRHGPGFFTGDEQRWRRELAFRGMVAIEDTDAATQRLYTWARTSPARSDGRPARWWVASALLSVYRPNPQQLTIAAGHQQLADVITDRLYGPSLGRSTVQRIVQAMCADGVLYQVSRGCSATVTGDRNHVSVYVIADLPTLIGEHQDHVDDLRKRLDGHHPVGDMGSDPQSCGRSLPRTTGEISPTTPEPQRAGQPWRYVPRTAAERDQALTWLATDLAWRLGRHDRRRLSGLLRDWFAAGWSAQALRAAFERAPDGTPFSGPLPGHHQRDRQGAILIRDLVGVLGWRLRAWQVGGEPGPPPIAAGRARRGRPRSATLPTEPVPPDTPPQPRPASRVAAMLADITAGRIAAAERDRAWRASRRPR